ncbi:MAG: response regulator transcription factor [Flavobacteriaceae bacterium]
MTSTISLVVADDHPILLKGLIEELKSFQYTVLGGAEHGAKALDLIIDLQPTIALLDIEMPFLTGIEVIQKCREQQLPTQFIILTSHKEKGLILQTKELGILGYILKEEPFQEVHRCIQSVVKGEPYYSKTFKDILRHEVSPELEKLKYLTPSERTILRLVGKGKSSKEIGELLTISYRTVEKHRANIISKLELPSHIDALSAWAKENMELLDMV